MTRRKESRHGRALPPSPLRRPDVLPDLPLGLRYARQGHHRRQPARGARLGAGQEGADLRVPREDVALVSGPAAAAASQARGFADPDLDGYITIPWDSLDHWFEEDEEVFVHPHDPFVRVDALKSSRHVRVERDGHLLAESDSPILVFETGLPTRYYLPERDVDPSLLADSDLETGCPYKGFASYRDVLLNGRRHRGLFWSYQ